MSTFKLVEDMLQQVVQGSVNLSNIKPELGPQRWRECIELYNDGWIQDGFDYVPESYDIVAHWKKKGEDRKSILLTLEEQQQWVRVLTKRRS